MSGVTRVPQSVIPPGPPLPLVEQVEACLWSHLITPGHTWSHLPPSCRAKRWAACSRVTSHVIDAGWADCLLKLLLDRRQVHKAY